MDFALPVSEDATKGIVDLTRKSRVRLPFAEDTRGRHPPDLDELAGAAALPEGELAQPLEPEPPRWADHIEALEAAKRDWQLKREALLEERKQQHQEFEDELAREKEVLRQQFLRDLTVQDKVTEQSRLNLQRQRESLKALRTQGEVDSAMQQAERVRLQRERDALDRQRDILARREMELTDLERVLRMDRAPDGNIAIPTRPKPELEVWGVSATDPPDVLVSRPPVHQGKGASPVEHCGAGWSSHRNKGDTGDTGEEQGVAGER
uniref:Uncharacterized protein n=1 Tax=Sphaerodactylus townsendi TaxID=933632 RepID=A0ACB8FC43_9SAUR